MLKSESSRTSASAALNEACDILDADLNTDGIEFNQSDFDRSSPNPSQSQECMLESEPSSSSAYSALLRAMDVESIPCFSYWCKNLIIPEALRETCLGHGTKRKVSIQLGPKVSKKARKLDLCDMLSNLCVERNTVMRKHWVKRAQVKKQEIQAVTESFESLELCKCKSDTCLTCTVNDLLRLATVHSEIVDIRGKKQRKNLLSTENLSKCGNSLSKVETNDSKDSSDGNQAVPSDVCKIDTGTAALKPQLTADGRPGQMLVLRDGSAYSRGNTLSIGRFLVQAWIVSAVLPAMSTAVNSPSEASYKNVSHPSLTSTLGHTTAVSTKSPYFKIFTSKAPVPS